MPINLEEKFKLYCNSENLEINPNQVLVIKKLQDFYRKNFKFSIFDLILKKNSKRGFYLFGDVGVGKTMILDFFFSEVDMKKRDFILMNSCCDIMNL